MRVTFGPESVLNSPLGGPEALETTIVKQSAWRIPRAFLQDWVAACSKELRKMPKHKAIPASVTLVFVEKAQMQSMNSQYRGKNKVTDILSFEGFGGDDGTLGDLVLCGEVVDAQALEHELSSRQELGYLVIHGLLHLLGYEHEQGGRPEKVMFALQDQLFESLWPRFFRD